LLEILHRGGEPVGASEDYRIRYHGGAQAAASGEVAAPAGHGCAIITIRHGDGSRKHAAAAEPRKVWKEGTIRLSDIGGIRDLCLCRPI